MLSIKKVHAEFFAYLSLAGSIFLLNAPLVHAEGPDEAAAGAGDTRSMDVLRKGTVLQLQEGKEIFIPADVEEIYFQGNKVVTDPANDLDKTKVYAILKLKESDSAPEGRVLHVQKKAF